MSVHIRTKEPIEGSVEYSFKLDPVLGEVIFVENGNMLLVKSCNTILFCCSMENIGYMVRREEPEEDSRLNKRRKAWKKD